MLRLGKISARERMFDFLSCARPDDWSDQVVLNVEKKLAKAGIQDVATLAEALNGNVNQMLESVNESKLSPSTITKLRRHWARYEANMLEMQDMKSRLAHIESLVEKQLFENDVLKERVLRLEQQESDRLGQTERLLAKDSIAVQSHGQVMATLATLATQLAQTDGVQPKRSLADPIEDLLERETETSRCGHSPASSQPRSASKLVHPSASGLNEHGSFSLEDQYDELDAARWSQDCSPARPHRRERSKHDKRHHTSHNVHKAEQPSPAHRTRRGSSEELMHQYAIDGEPANVIY